ncbi:MAG TPA: MFS transporter [Gaiellaceae bacterium]|nr:MFS transporter [Gaiellaceae bacterium]
MAYEETERAPAASRRAWLTRGVGSVGLASFFSDFGHEVATSVLPSFVTVVLRSSPGALGLIEGISDALTGVAKLIGGPLANDPSRRLRMASGGYLITAAATGTIGAAGTVWQAGLARAAAWLARGVRSPARDAMLASLARPEAYGRAFGLERAGDNLGAVAGPLLAAGLVAWLGIRPALYLSAVPGVFAAVAITVAAAEARKSHNPEPRRARLELSGLREAGLLRPLLPIAAFELGNMATTLLILRATTLLHHGDRTVATATSLAVLIYAGHNLFGSFVAYGGGHWLDRAGPRVVFASGGLVYIAAYALFALPFHSVPLLVVAFLLAGSGIGFAETAESALVARLLPDRLRGSGFGLLGGVQSLGDFASSAVVGLLWPAVSPTVAFAYAAGWMAISVAAAGALTTPAPLGRSGTDPSPSDRAL